MKTIELVSIWVNGVTKEAAILNAYAVNVSLGNSATFYYQLLSENKVVLAQGNLIMSQDECSKWEIDTFAWDWIAEKLNLVITGDYIEPVYEEPIIEEIIEYKVEPKV